MKRTYEVIRTLVQTVDVYEEAVVDGDWTLAAFEKANFNDRWTQLEGDYIELIDGEE